MKTQKEVLKLVEKVIKEDVQNEIYLELFNEVYLIGYKIANKEMSSKFNAIPMEVEDFISTIYLVYIDTIRWFKMTNEKIEKFLYYFAFKVKQAIINDCRSFIRGGHIILNYAKCEENYNLNIDNKNIDVEKQMRNKAFVDDLISKLVGIQKKIVILKLQGYSTSEISKILNRPCNTIAYEWKKVIQKTLI